MQIRCCYVAQTLFMQIGPLFTQILSLFTQFLPCLCRLYPCLHRPRPCLQTLSLLTPTLFNSIPTLFTQAPFQSAEALALCRVPTAWDKQQARGLVSVCLAGPSPHKGWAQAVPRACRGGEVWVSLLLRTLLKLCPLLPRLWHCL